MQRALTPLSTSVTLCNIQVGTAHHALQLDWGENNYQGGGGGGGEHLPKTKKGGAPLRVF